MWHKYSSCQTQKAWKTTWKGSKKQFQSWKRVNSSSCKKVNKKQNKSDGEKDTSHDNKLRPTYRLSLSSARRSTRSNTAVFKSTSSHLKLSQHKDPTYLEKISSDPAGVSRKEVNELQESVEGVEVTDRRAVMSQKGRVEWVNGSVVDAPLWEGRVVY